MKIEIIINADKAILKTEVRGTEIEFGMGRVGRGHWKQFTDNNLDDYYDSGVLESEEVEALENIDLSELQQAFQNSAI